MRKFSVETKIAACKEYLEGKLSHREICDKYSIKYYAGNCMSILMDWLAKYKCYGEDAFKTTLGNKSYSKEYKIFVVEKYLEGNGSLKDIAAKYKIHSKETLRRWVLMYNANIELKDYDPRKEVYMAGARRKTTIEERKEIVEYCINNNRNYKGTASKYDVSYNQVYTWVKKYDIDGEEGLLDKRGRHKTDNEVDELERLRRENERLKHKLKENDMLVQLLKKVKEFEGM